MALLAGPESVRCVCVYVAGQRKVWCAKRFAPLSPTPRSPKFPALPPPFSGFFGKRQRHTCLLRHTPKSNIRLLVNTVAFVFTFVAGAENADARSPVCAHN